MGSFAGREEMLVNMWRNQVGAEPVSPEEARKALERRGGGRGGGRDLRGEWHAAGQGDPHRHRHAGAAGWHLVFQARRRRPGGELRKSPPFSSF